MLKSVINIAAAAAAATLVTAVLVYISFHRRPFEE